MAAMPGVERVQKLRPGRVVSGPMVIFDPAAAIAASRCLAARVRDPQRWLTTDHPSRCGWCDYPTAVLDGMIRGFHRWSGWKESTRTYGHHELRVWQDTKELEQRALVAAAQVLEESPPPAPGAPVAEAAETAPPAPADASPPPPDWLGGPP